MTNEQIRIAVAECCGWKPRKHCKGWYREYHDGYVEELPNYPEDLNAMHEAEETLHEDMKYMYGKELASLTTPQKNNQYRSTLGWDLIFSFVHATARQRCEAFLRTLGKWKD